MTIYRNAAAALAAAAACLSLAACSAGITTASSASADAADSSRSAAAVAFIQFSGHGIKGTIDSVAKFPDSVGIPGLGHKNVTSVTITPR